jgi:ribosomal protein S17E
MKRFEFSLLERYEKRKKTDFEGEWAMVIDIIGNI